MPSLKNMSRLQIVYISLLAWFLPSCFLLVQLHAKGMRPGQSLMMLPLLYGALPGAWLGNLFDQEWIKGATSVIFAIALPAGFVLLMLRMPKWRGVILAVGLILFCALTAAAYSMLKA